MRLPKGWCRDRTEAKEAWGRRDGNFIFVSSCLLRPASKLHTAVSGWAEVSVLQVEGRAAERPWSLADCRPDGANYMAGCSGAEAARACESLREPAGRD